MPDDQNVYAELDDAAQQLLRDYVAAAEAARLWDERRERLANLMFDRLGEANKGVVNGRTVVTRVGSGVANMFSQSRFREAYPDLYQDFVVPTPRRPHLRVAES